MKCDEVLFFLFHPSFTRPKTDLVPDACKNLFLRLWAIACSSRFERTKVLSVSKHTNPFTVVLRTNYFIANKTSELTCPGRPSHGHGVATRYYYLQDARDQDLNLPARAVWSVSQIYYSMARGGRSIEA